MDLTSIERLPLLKDALSIGDGLRFASVPDSERRVITDSTGIKYINLRNEDIREILGSGSSCYIESSKEQAAGRILAD